MTAKKIYIISDATGQSGLHILRAALVQFKQARTKMMVFHDIETKTELKKVLDQAKGYSGRRNNVFRIAKEAVMKAGQYQYRGPPQQEARVPCAVDRAHQRRSADVRPVVQPDDRRPAQGRCRGRSKS